MVHITHTCTQLLNISTSTIWRTRQELDEQIAKSVLRERSSPITTEPCMYQQMARMQIPKQELLVLEHTAKCVLRTVQRHYPLVMS
jgi:hypothetical protein